MRSRYVFAAALVACVIAAGGRASAQEWNVGPVSPDAAAPAGWTFTPSLSWGAGWDDNVLARGNGDQAPSDIANVLNPRGTLNLNGRRGQLSASYDGAFVLYRDLNSLNSYDQHASFSASRQVSRSLALFVRSTAASVPTTELSQFVAVPFTRTGSRLNDTHGGVDATLSKHTSLIASYNFEWVDFDRSAIQSATLLGGHSHGATVTLKHLVSTRVTLLTEYDLQHATFGAGAEPTNLQHGWAGGEYHFSQFTHAFAEAGIARLGATAVNDVRTGPAWRLGLTREFSLTAVDLLYDRSFVPSYGFGGTTQNEEVVARLRLPLTRRAYSTTSLAWRHTDPITDGELPLHSYWLEGTLGYSVTPALRLEIFYEGTRQTIDQVGGQFDRNRVGVQVTTAKSMRLQ